MEIFTLSKRNPSLPSRMDLTPSHQQEGGSRSESEKHAALKVQSGMHFPILIQLLSYCLAPVQGKDHSCCLSFPLPVSLSPQEQVTLFSHSPF